MQNNSERTTEITSHSQAETQGAAKKFLAFLKEKSAQSTTPTTASHQACIVGLYGDLGAGKTTFSQCVAQELGIDERVTSPTFVIEKIYPTKDTQFTHFVHIDAYRLENGKELHVLDFERLTQDPHNLIFIEWPEKVADILPQEIFKIYFNFIDEHTRTIRYDM